MHFSSLFSHVLALLLVLRTTTAQSAIQPPVPSLAYLYTVYQVTGPSFFDIETPSGPRGIVPSYGGNFSGPGLSGTIIPAGGDFGGSDPNTGLFHVDARLGYNTSDGAAIYVSVTGVTQPDGSNHITSVHQTQDKRYFWLNDVVSIGKMYIESASSAGYVFRADIFYVSRLLTSPHRCSVCNAAYVIWC